MGQVVIGHMRVDRLGPRPCPLLQHRQPRACYFRVQCDRIPPAGKEKDENQWRRMTYVGINTQGPPPSVGHLERRVIWRIGTTVVGLVFHLGVLCNEQCRALAPLRLTRVLLERFHEQARAAACCATNALPLFIYTPKFIPCKENSKTRSTLNKAGGSRHISGSSHKAWR